MESLLSALLPP
jgi:hypothetical protein